MIADATHGLFGRSPDHVSSFVTGFCLNLDVFDGTGPAHRNCRANMLAYYRHMRRHDIFAAYAVVTAQGSRSAEFHGSGNHRAPALAVVRETDEGVIVNGLKMLATGAIYANELWVGNVLPLAPGSEAQAITFAIPVATARLSLWSRKPFAAHVRSEFDNPLSSRFDESDAVVIFDDVLIPWERVFVHNDVKRSRDIYIKTPSHVFGNHQSNVRFLSKLRLMLSLAHRIALVNGQLEMPAVRDTIAKLASREAALAGLIQGQLMDPTMVGEFVSCNRRSVYAALSWCQENANELSTEVRMLMGAGVFQMPADDSVFDDPMTDRIFKQYMSLPATPARERMKLYKLAWDLLGSEFAQRHFQYENFYAGAPFVVRDHSFREAPWEELSASLDALLGSYGQPTIRAMGEGVTP
jgi:4-hydroxyphenylacetate 3-monooxygenase